MMHRMNHRICECCQGVYATGKNYGGFWESSSRACDECEVKGLCEFCNPNDKTWYLDTGFPQCKNVHTSSNVESVVCSSSKDV